VVDVIQFQKLGSELISTDNSQLHAIFCAAITLDKKAKFVPILRQLDV
jgi:hypothetical protein